MVYSIYKILKAFIASDGDVSHTGRYNNLHYIQKCNELNIGEELDEDGYKALNDVLAEKSQFVYPHNNMYPNKHTSHTLSEEQLGYLLRKEC